MEAKASKMSQRSVGQDGSQQKLGKTASKASLTPSQMSERTRLNMAAANKDPLDALSRSAQRPAFAERRSGLQDVDDDYLKNVVYAYSNQTRTDSTQKAKVTADMMPAGVPTLRSPHRSVLTNERMQAVPEAAPAQEQGQPPQKAEPVAQVDQAKQENPTKTEPVPASQSPPQTQTEATPPTSPAAQPQGVARQQGGGEPELYTTCPNCRATLYLVRNAGDPSPYAAPQEGATSPKKH